MSMRISRETIYRSLYIGGHGGLGRELLAVDDSIDLCVCLVPGHGSDRQRSPSVRSPIDARPEEVDSRDIAGHGEGF